LFSNGGPLGSAVLDFSNFPKPSKTAKIDQKMIKINKLTGKRFKNVKFSSKSNDFLIKKTEVQNSEKTGLSKSGCHGNVKLKRQ